MKSQAAVRRIVEELKVLYPDARCSLTYEKDYELLFAVRLSAQCTDARVNTVTPSLFRRFPTLEAFAAASYEEVGEAIRSCGFYNTKSKDLVECAKILLEKYGGRVTYIYGTDWNQRYTKLSTLIASGEQLDVYASGTFQDIPVLPLKSLLLPVDDYLEDTAQISVDLSKKGFAFKNKICVFKKI